MLQLYYVTFRKKDMLNHDKMMESFKMLDGFLAEDLNLLIGGGAALILDGTTNFTTYDIDAMPFKSSIGPHELRVYRDKVSQKLDIPKDWLNEYFYQFAHSLPLDYGDRIKEIYKGQRLKCYILSPTDMVIMKCFAMREKDELHIRYLLKRGDVKVDFIDDYLQDLILKNYPNAESASNFFNNILEALGYL